MIFFRIILILLLSFNLAFGSKKINLENMLISDYINIVVNNMNKNIMLNDDMDGEIDFILKKNRKLTKNDFYPLLLDILKSRGYFIKNSDLGYLEVVILDEKKLLSTNANKDNLLTKIIDIKEETIEEIVTKVEHLLSKDAKMIINSNLNLIILSEYSENFKHIEQLIGSIQNENEVIAQFINLKYAKASDVIDNIKKLLKLLFKNEKVEIISDEIRNSLILISARANIYKLKPYVKKFDVINKITTKKASVFPLKSLNHNNALNILKTIFSENKKIKITSDSSSNSIIAFASEKELQYITDILYKLDKQKEQVYIKIKILEINEDRWSSFRKKYKLVTNPFLSGNNFINLNLLLTEKIVNEVSNYTTQNKLYDIKNLLNNSSDLNKSKLNFNIPQNYLLASTLSLLDSANALNIVLEPTILSLSNEEVSLNIDEIKNSNIFKETNLKLKITPRVLNSKKVKFDIDIKFKNIDIKRDINTKVILGSSESLIINGLKSDFIKKSFLNLSDNINLMIILTPYIIEKDKTITEFEKELSISNKLEGEYVQSVLNLLKAVESESNRDIYDIFKSKEL